jgi:ZIP family zinc transporter
MPEAALLGLAASLVAGAMTGLGGLAAGFGGALDERRQNLLIGFAAGVMIAAAFFSLILPAIARVQGSGASPASATLAVGAAVALGALAIAWLGGAVERGAVRAGWPRHPDADAVGGQAEMRRVMLIVIAITLHNLPEGMAVGLGFMSGDPQLGFATMLGIGIQNIPEGMAVAAVLATLGWSRLRCGLAALATGLIEPLGGALAVGVVRASTAALPWALGISAGAMLFVALAEMLPHARRRIEHGSATPALLAGLGVMMFLDISLG